MGSQEPSAQAGDLSGEPKVGTTLGFLMGNVWGWSPPFCGKRANKPFRHSTSSEIISLNTQAIRFDSGHSPQSSNLGAQRDEHTSK